jgi:hypothetical protein
MAGSGLKSAKRKGFYIVPTNHEKGNHMLNANSQDLTFHKFGTGYFSIAPTIMLWYFLVLFTR